jgi:hypothetical protein
MLISVSALADGKPPLTREQMFEFMKTLPTSDPLPIPPRRLTLEYHPEGQAPVTLTIAATKEGGRTIRIEVGEKVIDVDPAIAEGLGPLCPGEISLEPAEKTGYSLTIIGNRKVPKPDLAYDTNLSVVYVPLGTFRFDASGMIEVSGGAMGRLGGSSCGGWTPAI